MNERDVNLIRSNQSPTSWMWRKREKADVAKNEEREYKKDV